jgi:nucleotide-binding universal stress UspA family protein
MSGSSILVPLDGTAPARAALPVARALGQILDASLHMLHVSVEPPLPLAALASRLGLAKAALPRWSIAARVGVPATAIIDEAGATHARLIVMCTHASATRPKGILGRTALGVLRDAPCPVVLVPPGTEESAWIPKQVLLPYDGSPAANAAVAPAGELARRADAELVVLQVGAAESTQPVVAGSLAMPRYVDQPHHEWPQWAGELLKRLACLSENEVQPRLRVLGGEPSREIVRMAASDRNSLIVLAWKGAWSGGRAATLKAVLRDASCPVMVVHAITGNDECA